MANQESQIFHKGQNLEAKSLTVDGTEITATADELNKMDGVTSTAATLNTFDNRVAGATIVVGTEVPNDINVTVQLTDADGNDLATAAAIPFYLSSDTAGQAIGTAPDGGIAIGTDGLMIEWTANVAGLLISEADGDIDITFTESGSLTVYLVLVMPNGSLVISDAITF
jgi:hypothetical protein